MTEQNGRYDLVVLGGGPGGYPAAIRAAQLGAAVALVEKRWLGGTCLNEGCIPTKAYVRAAKIMQDCRAAGEHGVLVDEPEMDLAATAARKDEVVDRLKGGVRQLLEGNGVDIYDGLGVVDDAHHVTVRSDEGDETRLETSRLLLAVGSEKLDPPIDGIDLPGVIGSREILNLQHVPEHLIIMGGNVIGLEFASIFNAFGAEVTVLGRNPRLLKYLDDEISRRIRPVLRKKGINVITDAPVTGIEGADAHDKIVRYERRGKEQEAAGDLVLNAVGRKPSIEQLPLDQLGVETESGAVVVNEEMVTSNPDVLAVGDATGGMMLAHVATAEGIVAADCLFGEPHHINQRALPDVAFTMPEAASVGYHEDEARETFDNVDVAKFSLTALGKAVAIGETDGLVKIVFDADSQQVLGMHILGSEAPILIQEGVLAIESAMTVEDLARCVHVHPTLSEAVMEAAHVGIDSPVHILPR